MKSRFCFLGSIKFEKHKPSWFYSSWVTIKAIFILKNLVRYLWTSKQQTTLRMIFLKHNSLKLDIFLNPIFIPCFSESKFFRIQVFQGPVYSGSMFFRVQVIQGLGFSGSRFFRVLISVSRLFWIQVLEVA